MRIRECGNGIGDAFDLPIPSRFREGDGDVPEVSKE